MLPVSSLNVKLNRLQPVCRSPEWSLGHCAGLKIPQGLNLSKQSPPELLMHISVLPVGFWLAAGLGHSRTLTRVQPFGEDWGGQAEEELSCKSGDPDWITSSMILDVLCPFPIYCWQHDKAFATSIILKQQNSQKQTKQVSSKHTSISDYRSALAIRGTLS